MDEFIPDLPLEQHKDAGHLGGIAEALGQFNFIPKCLLDLIAPNPCLEAVELIERPPLQAEGPVKLLCRVADISSAPEVKGLEIFDGGVVVGHVHEYDFDAASLDGFPTQGEVVEGLFAENTAKMPQENQHHRTFERELKQRITFVGNHFFQHQQFFLGFDWQHKICGLSNNSLLRKGFNKPGIACEIVPARLGGVYFIIF